MYTFLAAGVLIYHVIYFAVGSGITGAMRVASNPGRRDMGQLYISEYSTMTHLVNPAMVMTVVYVLFLLALGALTAASPFPIAQNINTLGMTSQLLYHILYARD